MKLLNIGMYTYTLNEDEVFDSLKGFKVDESTLEPLLPSSQVGPKLCGEHNGMYGKKHKESTLHLMSQAKIGKVTVKDSNGNISRTTIDDPRFINGELVGIAKGKISVKDSNGNKFLVIKEDPRFLSGELVGVAKGSTYKQKVPSPHKGTFLAKDKEGNMCRITKADPRYISGELIHFRSKF